MTKATLALFVTVALVGPLPTATASAATAHPVTYTGLMITDGQLGSWKFHNARVTLNFVGDTSTVQTVTTPGGAQVSLNTVGRASVLIATPGKTRRAIFTPNQVFVSLDPGSDPGGGGRGIGFGSYTATGDFEPAYPLGVEDGMIDWGDAASASSALTGLPLDLTQTTGFSGRAFTCVGFFDTTCPTPTKPLVTDHGDLYLYQPYRIVDPSVLQPNDPLQGGVVLSTVGIAKTFIPNWLRPTQANPRSRPITYSGYMLGDVTLGSRQYNDAQVYLSMKSSTSAAAPYSDGTSSGYVNSVGSAEVRVTSAGQTVSATFQPHQLYVYYDVTHGSIGFGSYAGGRGYPLSLTANDQTNPSYTDSSGLVENSSIGAITDILTTPTDAARYTPATAALVTNLTNATVLSGAAASCKGFDPATSVCSDTSPVALATSKGSFYLSQPYTVDDGLGEHSANWGLFWANRGSRG